MIVKIVFPLPFQKAFSYSVPEEFENKISVGKRVVAPFGKRVLTGFVVDFFYKSELSEEEELKIKEILDVLDTEPIFNKDSLKFYQWLSEYYLSSLGEALSNSVPAGLEVETRKKIVADVFNCKKAYEAEKNKKTIRSKILRLLSVNDVVSFSFLQKEAKTKNIYSVIQKLQQEGFLSVVNEIENAKVRVKKIKHIRLKKRKEEIFELISLIEKKSPKQSVILLYLLSLKTESVSQAELLAKTKASQSSIKGLADKGLIEVFDKEVKRIYEESFSEKKLHFELTPAQKNVIEKVNEQIKKNSFKPFLLHGITGSGKTQVYIELAKKTLAQNKSVIILVPEISLTPQMTTRFRNEFGNLVAVLHSKMGMGERYDSWRMILEEKIKIVIGPRSALFAPLKNIGFIVVDEEHDQSYKQNEMQPKYHARDAAVVLAKLNNAPIILGSATPSIESMFNARSGKYELLELPERVDNANLPDIKLININNERKKGRMENVFSNKLLLAIKERIDRNESVIILQNRRGFATQVFCEDCGEIVMCTDCSVPMVHHISKNILICHYCGASRKVPKACENCGSVAIKFFGVGTQRVEDELDFYLPEVRMQRVDSDTINKKGKLSSILNSFKEGEIDILIGTQIVSKGLDFSNVTLVGVISAETSLWMPDFRADEKTFQLLTQVAGRAGRAGRSNKKGEVLIQTMDDSNFVLQKVKNYDYNDFYNAQIKDREKIGYPPFSRLCLIESKDLNEEKAFGVLMDLYKIISKYKNIVVSLPMEAIVFKLKGYYRFQIILKSYKKNDPGGALLRKVISESMAELNSTTRFKNVKIYFDIDPQNVT